MTRTWRSTDTCGNSSFCNQTVTIVDTEPPNIHCAPDKQAQWGDAWAFDIPTAVDKCDLNNVLIEVVATVTNVANPRCPALFSVTRTWRSTDTCGNSSFCNQTVTVVDTLPPRLFCPSDRIVECGIPWNFARPSAVDLCDGTNITVTMLPPTTNFLGCPNTYTVQVTWQATDGCGNVSECNQGIWVADTTPPNLFCQPDRIVECGTPWTFGQPSAHDLCDPGPILPQVFSTETNRSTCLNIYTRTWMATDCSGNPSYCSQTIKEVDTTPPAITCPPNFSVQCLSNLPPCATSLAEFLALGGMASDNCAGHLTYACWDGPLMGGLCGGHIARTHTVTDDCNNTNICEQIITIHDTIPPLITCPPNISVQCLGDVPPCPATLAAFRALGGTASDNCDANLGYICHDSMLMGGTCGGTIWRIFTVIDDCNNTNICEQIITINDTLPPSITCPPDLTVPHLTNVPPCPGSLAAFVAAGGAASDNCDVQLGYSCADGPFMGVGCGRIVRTHTVVDDCGNQASCLQVITVNDCPSPAPRLLQLHVMSVAEREISIVGEAGRTYVIEATEDFVTWKPIASAVNVEGTLRFSDAENPSKCFYRAVLQP